MEPKNRVYIATSLDGYIADREGRVDWLNEYPMPEDSDLGYDSFMSSIDAIVMGRKTFETVLDFDIEWPYNKPVYVLSNRWRKVPEGYVDKVTILGGDLAEVLATIHQIGHTQLYIDGGKTIQHFLREDRIDEMIITTIPLLLGSGIPLFSPQPKSLSFKCVSCEFIGEKISQRHFVRK